MEPIQIISQDLFDKVRSRFQNLEMGDKTGAVTIDPAEARFFDFDFVHEGTNLGRVSISLGDLGSLKVYYSQGITENHDDLVKHEWFKFLKEMRFFAMRRLLRFDTRDIAKNNLDKNDFQHLAATQGPKEEPDMTTMNESRWNSNKNTRKTSRAVKGKTEVIVRHANPVDETFAGARSQRKNIKSIFIQNKDGERFKYPFIHPAGAFAMAQHVDHGGVPHDPAGKAIIEMSEQIAQLQEFQRKIHRATLHDDATGISERAIGRLNELKARVDSLSKRQHYENWIAEFNECGVGSSDAMVLDDVTMEQYKQAFTQSTFQEELAGYFPLLHRIMSETNAVDLENYVDIQVDESNESFESIHEKTDELAEFEEWADSIEQGTLTSDQINALKQAIGDLDGNLQLGTNGDDAWEFFSNSGIDSLSLKDKLEQASDEEQNGTEVNALDIFKQWAEDEGQRDLLMKLGLETAQPEEPQVEPEEEPQVENEEAGGMPNSTMPTRESIVKEVARLVKCRYNKDNRKVGPFNGKENIALDVKKKCAEMFGEEVGDQAENLAMQFMEKLTNEWQEKHGNVEVDGLARLKELLGNVKQKVECMGGDITQNGHAPGNNIMQGESAVSEGLDSILKLSGLAK